jgi:hypothetical protein
VSQESCASFGTWQSAFIDKCSWQCSDLSPKLPSGWFNWIIPFFRIPESEVLKYASLDGFLFLRYLRVLALLCFAGVCFAWPILLPLHATGGLGLVQLDALTIGNVESPTKFYAHVMIAWSFFGEHSVSLQHVQWPHHRDPSADSLLQQDSSSI